MFWLVGHSGAGRGPVSYRSGRTSQTLFGFLTVLIVSSAVSPVQAFDLPKYDPWYYHSHEQGYYFAIPDKAQHFYGSAIVNEFSKRLPLPAIEVLGPVISLTAGFMWETYQEQKGLGFSERDLAADAMGVIASQLSSERLSFWLDYSTTEEVIMFRLSFRLNR